MEGVIFFKNILDLTFYINTSSLSSPCKNILGRFYALVGQLLAILIIVTLQLQKGMGEPS